LRQNTVGQTCTPHKAALAANKVQAFAQHSPEKPHGRWAQWLATVGEHRVAVAGFWIRLGAPEEDPKPAGLRQAVGRQGGGWQSRAGRGTKQQGS
jgi:hypothetical protein